MRRALSVLLFVLGGWLVATQAVIGFIDPGVGAGFAAAMLGMILILAAPFLLLGAWISPGARWRELGLTILIAVGATLATCLSMAALLLDPDARRLMGPMPDIKLSPVMGAVNLLIVAGVGAALYWSRRRSAEGEPKR